MNNSSENVLAACERARNAGKSFSADCPKVAEAIEEIAGVQANVLDAAVQTQQTLQSITPDPWLIIGVFRVVLVIIYMKKGKRVF